MILVSACLCGMCTTWKSDANTIEEIKSLLAEGKCIPLCPEQLGGLPTPRPPAEISGGSAEDVLDGKARVLRQDGTDVTDCFIRGAEETLKIAKLLNPETIILKENSPSCGVAYVYDGTHTGKRIPGAGITTALLKRHGFKVISEKKYK
jgi:uncharacterized protein YbbK (DUF523 family)